ncbi:lysophospholipid acyltransferase family protein [Acidicapsa acidisoli]|uniref:lysophospholipid acyltransferase family protein n=1 Tax=Acidicapsa acidisoli TaxID=1615681 RepID=UPI0021E0EE48|nr:lysophospholipid acyltransferase family protein [Acidicapsa acidisoli]
MRPNQLSFFIRQRSNILLAPPFLLATAFFGSLALAASLFDKHGGLQHRIARVWAHACVLFSGATLQVIGLENIPAETAVFASNHTSYMDTPVVFASLPFQFRILAKKELWTLPFIGWYLDRSGQIPIDTANPRTTLSSFAAGVKTLRGGLNVFVFPEGGRTPDGNLQTFLNGAAFLAIRGQVPLVPIALVGVRDLLPMHTRHFYPSPNGTPLKLIFGKPIQTKHHHLRESEALTAQLREAIDQLIQQHS